MCSSRGSTADLNQGLIRRFRLALPSLPVQRRIADILSAYDELMENSRRRIQLLEAMARALYREWFVHFRFPGHEKLRKAPSLGEIPQGWEMKTVESRLRFPAAERRRERKPSIGTTEQSNGSRQATSPCRARCSWMTRREHITELGLAESSARLFPAFSVMLTSRATIGAISINTTKLAQTKASSPACRISAFQFIFFSTGSRKTCRSFSEWPPARPSRRLVAAFSTRSGSCIRAQN